MGKTIITFDMIGDTFHDIMITTPTLPCEYDSDILIPEPVKEATGGSGMLCTTFITCNMNFKFILRKMIIASHK